MGGDLCCLFWPHRRIAARSKLAPTVVRIPMWELSLLAVAVGQFASL
ncbi:hypothetical protein SAMN04490180_3080 [Pseudomonas brassicacearum]|nr:hypothetical protein DFO59_101539 [Pseudomonas fluorescens]SDP81752.1 hypothetical protein SAMN04490180_3080 [Pseudomonas brassicacearum]